MARQYKYFCIRLLCIVLCVALSFGFNESQGRSRWRYALSGMVKAGVAATLTDEELAEKVRKEVAVMDSKNKVCPPSSAYSKRLAQLTKGMDAANGIKLNFKVYLTTDYNAFACPDGSVRVFSALMDAFSDDELLGVIGHEIGHVALRHSKKAWRSALLRSAASDAMSAMSSNWAAVSDTFVGAVCSQALSAKNSRYHETQADEYSYRFLKKCGKNPWATGLMLLKLKKLSKQPRYANWLKTFSSHPDFDARVEHIRKLARKDGYKCQ